MWFEDGTVKYIVNFGRNWESQTISHDTNSFSDLEGPIILFGKLVESGPGQGCLAVRAKLNIYPITNVVCNITTFAVSLRFHGLLCLLEASY